MTPLLGMMASGATGSKQSSYESIATVNPTSGTSVSFTSIPSTYKHLQIRYLALTAANGEVPRIQFNGDTGNNYARHRLTGDGATAAASGGASTTDFWVTGSSAGTDTTNPMVGIVNLQDYASTTINKTGRVFAGLDKNGSGQVFLGSGVWLNTSAITSITIYIGGSSFATGSTFALYGIKG
jgi:hypothetical protein